MSVSMNNIISLTDGYGSMEDGNLICEDITCNDIICNDIDGYLVKSNSLLSQSDCAVSGDLGCINIVVGKSLLVGKSIVTPSIMLNHKDLESSLIKYIGMRYVYQTVQTFDANVPKRISYEYSHHDEFQIYNDIGNYFLPTIKGYYSVHASYTFITTTKSYLSVYLNDTEELRGSYMTKRVSGEILCDVSGIVYCSGVDKISIFGTSDNTTIGGLEKYNGVFHIFKI